MGGARGGIGTCHVGKVDAANLGRAEVSPVARRSLSGCSAQPFRTEIS
jgi:hypothetical protein